MDPAPRTTDPITGLPDRRAFDDALSAECAQAGRTRRPLSLVVIELDGFAAITDSHGSARTERALREAGRALVGAVRSTRDALYRWRGDGFAVLLPNTGGYQAEEVARRLVAAVARECKRPDGTRMTASAGAAQLTDADRPFELVEAADAVMRDAKSARALAAAQTLGR